MHDFFGTPIKYLGGVGEHRAEWLQKEMQLVSYGDLVQHYPFRYEDRSMFHKIKDIQPSMEYVQIVGEFKSFKTMGSGAKTRLHGVFSDDTGSIDVVWFKGLSWFRNSLSIGVKYVVYGKVTLFNQKWNIAHPDIEVLSGQGSKMGYLSPVYHTTEKLKKKGMDSRFLGKIIKTMLPKAVPHISEPLPSYLLSRYGLIEKKKALAMVHFPGTMDDLLKARNRLKFEELFFIQVQLIRSKVFRANKFKGVIINNSELLNRYYKQHLPFELTNAQKKVIKEIYGDLRSGIQMNRLVQGDVGSGKTMVAFLTMLLAIGSGYQCAFMAPTEILADQHFNELRSQAQLLGLHIAKLTGSSSALERRLIHEGLISGVLSIVVGTHALLEDQVKFACLGLAVIDEQHRFGVAQRAKLWTKTKEIYPHVLVMTATPIPRTLAMTVYGDLDISIMDELPSGRSPIHTQHFRDSRRLEMFGFIEKEMAKGRQAYIVYPLIEESASLDYKDLMDGYASVSKRFCDYQISIVHGRMKAEAKDFEMRRFVEGETQLMVATTVVEVGVNVPNATLMVIENAERFGLSQLHQLRGRVGRSSHPSYCILMTGDKLSKEARARIQTMVDTTNGFTIAEMDLQLRGPGDLMGTRQSGVLALRISDLVKDGEILKTARSTAQELLKIDPHLEKAEHQGIKTHLESLNKDVMNWEKIS